MKNRPLIAPNIMIITLGLMLSAAGCGKAAPTIEAESRVVQDYSEATVSFLGPEGTYTQEACGVFFNKQGSYESYETVSDAVDALESGASEYAVIPQENDNNKTRFYVLSKDQPLTVKAQRLAFIASGSAKDLAPLMKSMENLNMTLITVHDRPLKTELGEYSYIMECTDCNYEEGYLERFFDNNEVSGIPAGTIYITNKN